jgi:O-6-methylguanine DNA methyltransferase
VEWIRTRLEEERTGVSWTILIESEEDGSVCGVAGLRRIESFRSSAEILLVLVADENGHGDVLDRVLKAAFYDFGLHRIEMRVPETETNEAWVIASGWLHDGILRSAMPTTDGFRNAELYSMLREEYDGYGIAFIPFARGWIHIHGGRDFIDSIGFQKPEVPIQAGPIRTSASMVGLCDARGNLLLQEGKKISPSRRHRLPREVEKTVRQIEEYLSGERREFDLHIQSNGSLFQQRVWAVLSEIPFGSTLTYEQVAMILTREDPAAARRLTRAIGSACSANPVPIVVPCHRVIGKDNKLVGFSGGLDVKEWLLEHEMFGVR